MPTSYNREVLKWRNSNTIPLDSDNQEISPSNIILWLHELIVKNAT